MLSTSYWGLVEQNGPWRQTPKDIANKHGNYRPHHSNANTKQIVYPTEVGTIGDGIGITPPNYLSSVVSSIIPPKSRKRLFNYRKYNRPDGYNYEQTGRQFMGAGLTEDPNLAPDNDGYVMVPGGDSSLAKENSFASEIPNDNYQPSGEDVVAIGSGYPNLGPGAMAGRAAALAAVTGLAAAALPFVTPLESRIEARRKSTGTDSTSSSRRSSVHTIHAVDVSDISPVEIESRTHLPSLTYRGAQSNTSLGYGGHMNISGSNTPIEEIPGPSVVAPSNNFQDFTRGVGENFRSNATSAINRLGQEPNSTLSQLIGVVGHNTVQSASQAASAGGRVLRVGGQVIVEGINYGAEGVGNAFATAADATGALLNNLAPIPPTPESERDRHARFGMHYNSQAQFDEFNGTWHLDNNHAREILNSGNRLGTSHHTGPITNTDALIAQASVGARTEIGQRAPLTVNIPNSNKSTAKRSPPPPLTGHTTTTSSSSGNSSGSSFKPSPTDGRTEAAKAAPRTSPVGTRSRADEAQAAIVRAAAARGRATRNKYAANKKGKGRT